MAYNIAEINKMAYEKLEKFYNENEPFQIFIDDTGTEDYNNWDYFDEEHFCVKDNVTVASGASRGVLIFDDFDWVIKFNFLEETDYRWDFCEVEVDIYNAALDDKMEEFFAKAWKGGLFHGRVFYLMEKADTDIDYINNDFNSGTYDSDPDYRGASGLEREDEETITNFFGNYYNKDTILKLLDYCYDNGVNDIYDGNVGYMNGKPVFIDYAGFRR